MGGRGTVCLSHVVLGDYIIHDEIHMGRNVRYVQSTTCHYQLYLGGRGTVYLSDSDYIIHMLDDVQWFSCALAKTTNSQFLKSPYKYGCN